MNRYGLPNPGEQRNSSAVPMSDEDLYWLLVVSAPDLVLVGESTGTEDPVNAPLLAWWNAMNGLDRKLAILAQKRLMAELGALPAAPWEDCEPDGSIIPPDHLMTWDELAAWAQAQDDAE